MLIMTGVLVVCRFVVSVELCKHSISLIVLSLLFVQV